MYPEAPETSLIYVPAYVFGPLVGGFVAGNFHKWIHEAAMNSAEECKDAEAEYGEMIQ